MRVADLSLYIGEMVKVTADETAITLTKGDGLDAWLDDEVEPFRMAFMRNALLAVVHDWMHGVEGDE